MKYIAVFLDDLSLTPLNFLIDKLDHLARFKAHHMIVMRVGGYFENGVTTIEIVPLHNTRRFELSQHAINRRQTNVFSVLN